MIVGNVFSVLLLPGPIRDREALAAVSGEQGKGGKDEWGRDEDERGGDKDEGVN